jgi:D-alanyl-D-alanine carboxypeptidase/D-alanyl-D-alanine-endopeptidase (penicillin-binding protein 4)
VFAVLAVLALASGGSRAADRSLGAGIAKPTADGAPWTARERRRLARDLDGLLTSAATLRGAHVGLLVIESRSGEALYARNADDAFVPASTLKLLTGSVALTQLTPRFRFQTQALLDAADATLYVRGGGDPLLRAADVDALAQSVRAAGIHALVAGVKIDASASEAARYPPGWSWDDFPYDYAAPLSAATVEENVVHLTVSPGAAVGAPLDVTGAPLPAERVIRAADCRPTPAVVVAVLATTAARGASGDVDLARANGCVAVTGALALGSDAQTLDAAVPDPVWYLHALALRALARHGVTVTEAAAAPDDDGAGTVPAGARVVWMHAGEPLADLLADVWWPSDNLVAEALLEAIARAQSGVPATLEHGLDAERAWLKRVGIDPATVTLVDGSGLSSYDRLTPRALAAILQADWNGPYRELVLDDLPLAGVRGTLATSFAGTLAERRTFAKTGSVKHTRGLAGYIATQRHGALTFAWSIDDWMGADADLQTLRARVLSRLIGD